MIIAVVVILFFLVALALYRVRCPKCGSFRTQREQDEANREIGFDGRVCHSCGQSFGHSIGE